MKILLLSLILTSTSVFAKFASQKIPEKGLTLKCRSTADIYQTDYDKDGRVFLQGKIFKADLIEDAVFKLGNYKSQKQDLKVSEIPVETGTLSIIDTVEDKKFSFGITNLPALETLGNRLDTFSANIGVVKNPRQGGFAANVELRCKVTTNFVLN